MFVPRTSKPEAGNKYYTTVMCGGWNPCIKGSPTDPDCDVLSNCVGWAVARFNEAIGKCNCNYLASTNAENMVDVAKKQGLKVGTKPELGAVICWAKGRVGVSSDGAGHVAVVEQINPDGSIITSESGWNAKNPFWMQTRKDDGNWGQSKDYSFVGFIYLPKEQKRTLKMGMDGDDVKTLQQKLKEVGQYNDKIDGHFGVLTRNAVLGFQFDNDMEIDGAVGAKTKEKLGI